MRAAQASESIQGAPSNRANCDTSSPEVSEQDEATLGERLRAARERRGLSCEDVAARLKLPAKLIARLERDDYEGLKHGVFLRGYLASYARLVDISVQEATCVAAEHMQTVPLVATGRISRSRFLFERYSVSATYLVLTAIIVVPAVWLATHGGLEQNLARTNALDPPAIVASSPVVDAVRSAPNPVTGTELLRDSEHSQDAAGGKVPADPKPVDQSPIIASMAPFPSAPVAAPEPEAGGNATDVVGSGTHTVSLKLAEQSWVEITAADGSKLEYAMLPAGSVHKYRSDGPISVRVGNAQGIEMRTDGDVVDLTPFQRGNVAHVRLFADDGALVTRVNQ